MPDILNCLANLSSDEVFTPPELANRMLDLLPPELFTNPETTFLDPCTKSGVFLREITKRLLAGLEPWEPDLQRRLDHILTHQVFGIALTQLTADMSRRTLYCTKRADEPKYSVTQAFVQSHNPQGHVLFSRIGHTWDNGKCRFCGASETVFGDKMRQGLETHAYQFIHTLEPQELFNMTFDVIIGNPPYQMDDGGNNASATPIYNLFVEKAYSLYPKYLCMIIPSRWYCGGRGLENFRNMMLSNQHLCYIYDYKKSSDCFPGIRNGGGICYFLIDSKQNSNEIDIVNYSEGQENRCRRPKLEFGLNILIRDNIVRNIYSKIYKHHEKRLSSIVFSQKPYGLRTNFMDFADSGNVKLYTKKSKKGYGFVTLKKITKNVDTIGDWKVVTSRSTSVPEEDNGQVLRMSQTFIVEPNAVVTESYVVIATFKNKEEAENCMSYIKTKLFRLLCQAMIVSPDVSSRTFELVPLLSFSKPWTDAELYEKYGLDEKEIAFIESMIRPMED